MNKTVVMQRGIHYIVDQFTQLRNDPQWNGHRDQIDEIVSSVSTRSPTCCGEHISEYIVQLAAILGAAVELCRNPECITSRRHDLILHMIAIISVAGVQVNIDTTQSN